MFFPSYFVSGVALTCYKIGNLVCGSGTRLRTHPTDNEFCCFPPFRRSTLRTLWRLFFFEFEGTQIFSESRLQSKCEKSVRMFEQVFPIFLSCYSPLHTLSPQTFTKILDLMTFSNLICRTKEPLC